MKTRRIMTVAIVGVAMSVMAAGPALAHFCYKTGWNAAAQAGAANSKAWLTVDDWHVLIDDVVDEGYVCEEGGVLAHAYIDELPEDTLLMGPGLTAGGTLKNGKGLTPGQFGFVPVWDFEAAC